IGFGSGLGFRLGRSAGFLLGGDGGDFLVARKRRNLVDRALVDETRRSVLLLLDRLRLLDDRRRIWSAFVARKLDRVADGQPRALVSGDRALDEQEAADRVRADDLEVLLGAVTRTHVPRHLLVLEHAARILAVAGRAVRAVGDGNAVGRAKTAEAPALHRSRKALALRDASDVDHLTGDEMLRADARPDVEQSVLVDAELDDLGLGLDLGLAESAALRLGDVLGLGLARAELDGGITVAVLFTPADDLQLFQLQDGDRHVPTVRLEQAGHSD